MDNNLDNQAINSAQKAIDAALKSNWQEAIKINKKILVTDPDDTEALNRLARAYYESGETVKARKTSQKVLKSDPLNKIAEKALEKYKGNKANLNRSPEHNIDVSDFIEETGTTKQAILLNLCSDNLISTLDSGDELLLVTHSHKVSVTTIDKKYVGKLADDLSARIRLLSKKGYKYKTIVKSADKQCVKIIIKELKRGSGFEGQQSFPRESSESVGELSS